MYVVIMLSANKQADLHSLLVVAASNGVVIATEKKLPSILVDENSVLPLQTLGLSIVALFLCFI